MTEKLHSVLGRVENIVGKGEKTGFQHFLYFLQCFQKTSFTRSLKVRIVLERLKIYDRWSRKMTSAALQTRGHIYYNLVPHSRIPLPYNLPFPKQALVFTYLHYKSFENTVGKGEIYRNEQFLLFPVFLPVLRTFSYCYQIWNCRLQNISFWMSLKCVILGNDQVLTLPKLEALPDNKLTLYQKMNFYAGLNSKRFLVGCIGGLTPL